MQWSKVWATSVASPSHPDRNEDRWWVASKRGVSALVDGMGGYRRKTMQGEVGGEHAAALAVEVLSTRLDDWECTTPIEACQAALRSAIETIHQRIWTELNWSGRVPKHENLGGNNAQESCVGVALTLFASCNQGQNALVAQHGDTRGYLLRNSSLVQVTEDQDRLLWERTTGALTEEEALSISRVMAEFDGVTLHDPVHEKMLRYFFDRSILGALGTTAECPPTAWSLLQLAPADRITLLSDGTYANLNQHELSSLLSSVDDPVGEVIELAQYRSLLPRFPDPANPQQPYNLRATRDDMTALVIEIGE